MKWSQLDVAFERHAQGRGPLPDITPAKGHYRPAPIRWAELPTKLANAFARLSVALNGSGMIGDGIDADTENVTTGYVVHRDAKKRSVAERLEVLDRRHKAWAHGKLGADDLQLDVLNTIAFVAMAPRSPDFVIERKRTLTREQRGRVLGLVTSIWLDHVIEDLETRPSVEVDEAGEITDRAIKRSKWRAEWRRRQQKRLEVLVSNVDELTLVRMGGLEIDLSEPSAPATPAKVLPFVRAMEDDLRMFREQNDTGTKKVRAQEAA